MAGAVLCWTAQAAAMAGADLTGAELVNADLTGTRLVSAGKLAWLCWFLALVCCIFVYLQLVREADWAGCVLTDAQLQGCVPPSAPRRPRNATPKPVAVETYLPLLLIRLPRPNSCRRLGRLASFCVIELI
jgi:hypothetical protein